jgi:catechol-2,3-dioxygenase
MKKFSVNGVYEVAIKVRDLAKAEAFYVGILNFSVGLCDEARDWAFLRAGSGGMIVLQNDKSDFPKQHFAFLIHENEVASSCRHLAQQGIEFEGPVFHEWMPAYSIYFADPDGHDLELCAPVSGIETKPVNRKEL